MLMDELKLPISLKIIRRVNFPRKLGILDRLYGKKLAEHGTQFVETYAGPVWKLDLKSPTHRWLVYGYYENKNVMRWIQQWLKDGGIAIESGVSFGQTLAYYVDVADKVISIDPLEKSIKWIEDIILHNQYTHITTVHAGLSNQNSILNLQNSNEQSTFREDWYVSKNLTTTQVQCFPLDKIADEHNIEHIRFWKLDVEGLDYEALEGAQNLLSKKNIDAIYIEITGGAYDKVRTYLNNFEYELFKIDRNLNTIEVENPNKKLSISYLALPHSK